MVRVFVSHAGQDRGLAGEVIGWLVDDGHELLFDQDLPAGLGIGEPWESRLFERLRWADAVVCLVTSAYVASVWCSAEVAVAISRGSLVLPVAAEAHLEHPLLTGIQHGVDYAGNPAAARAALSEALRRVDVAGRRGWVDGRSPFPGLRPFDTDMHRVFFGRRGEVSKLTELLRSPLELADRGVLVVTGPTGCGKSSLVRAGLLPEMAGEPGWWTLPAVLPGADPVGALAREITGEARDLGLAWELPQVRSRLDGEGPGGVMEELLLAAPGGGRRRLLIVIDQFEELLTLTGSADRARFAGMLRTAMDGPAQVVATLRPEFLAPMLASPELTGVSIRTFTLRPLPQESLPQVIQGPAELAGIEVDPELVTRLVADTGSGEALPLLAFTLQQLASDIPRGGRLSLIQYERLGGVRGALTSRAGIALADAMTTTGRTSEKAIDGLLELVTVDEQSRPTRNQAPLTEVPDEMARAEQTALRTRRAVERVAPEWDTTGRHPNLAPTPIPRQHGGRLWERGQLAAVVNDLDNPTRSQQPDVGSDKAPASPPARRWPLRRRQLDAAMVQLKTRAGDFVRASIRTDRRRSTRAITILSLLLIAALIAATVVYTQQRSATEHQQIAEQQRGATARQLLAQADAIVGSDPRTAESLVLAAHRLHPDDQTEAALFNHIVGTHLKSTLTGHTAAVDSVAFSPDGRTLATGSDDATVILWNVTDPARPGRIGQTPTGPTGHTAAVFSVAFSPDGRTLATGSDDTTVILWNVTDPTRPGRIGQPLTGPTGHTAAVFSVAFSPDGRTLATGSADTTVILWNVTDPTRPGRIGQTPTGPTGHTAAVDSVAFSPDGRTLATGSADTTVILWDITDPTRPGRIGQTPTGPTGHTAAVDSVAFSPDGRTLATGSADTTVILWDITDPTRPGRIGQTPTGPTGHTAAVDSVAFSPDGRTLATGSDDTTVILWDITDPTRPGRIGQTPTGPTGHTAAVDSVAFSPDGRTLATGSADTTVILWDITDPTRPGRIGQPLTGPTGPTAAVFSVAFSPDGRTLATGSADTTVILWDITDPTRPGRIGQPLTGHTDRVYSVAFSPDGRTLATGSYDTTVILWDITDPTRPGRIGQPLTGHTDRVYSVAFSPDGRTLATGSADTTVILWNVTDPTRPGRIGQPLTGHTDRVYSVAFSPDGRTLATGSYDTTVILWDITDPTRPSRIGQPLTGHTGPTAAVFSVAFSPDGRTLATGSYDTTVILWDITDPTRPNRIGQPLTDHKGAVFSVAFSPDGHTLATGLVVPMTSAAATASSSDDGTVILWNVTDPTRPTRIGQPLTGHINGVLSVAFSLDGHTLATGSLDTTVILWDITGMTELRDHLVERACWITGQGLTPDEWSRYIPDLPYQDACAP